jgi:hypothetical protein
MDTPSRKEEIVIEEVVPEDLKPVTANSKNEEVDAWARQHLRRIPQTATL